jgi:glycerol kinase
LLTTIAWRFAGGETHYALEGSVFVAGAVVQWLRDGLGILNSAAEVEALGASVPDSGGVVLVPALTGLGAPHWDPHARGAIFGLTRGTTRAHIARAALEGIALQVTEILKAMEADAKESDAGMHVRELRVDGGASVNNLLMQMQADLLGIPVVRSQSAEATVLGACYLAGLAAGIWGRVEEVAKQWRESRRFEPAMDSDQRDNMLSAWQHVVKRILSGEA